MFRVLFAKATVLVHFKTLGVVFAVFHAVVIATLDTVFFLASQTCKSYFRAIPFSFLTSHITLQIPKEKHLPCFRFFDALNIIRANSFVKRFF